MSNKKRMFQILDEMNVSDTENDTALVGVCNQITNVQRTKQGGLITIGVPAEVVNKAMDKVLNGGNDVAIILLAIDMKEYRRRESKKTKV